MLSLSDSLEPLLLRARYQSRELTPTDLVHGLIERLDRRPEDHAWIALISPEQLLARARDVQQRDVARQPLYGIPFAVKDNIDVAGLKTTAACPAFAYRADTSSPVVAQLLAAGAILLGKTNMDQFATGLVGTRSPYGAVCNAFNGAYIAGGSSAGSAVAVAAGLVSFALGTDTAGSGRVPAAFNNIVGLKPTRGLLSSRGIVPACRSLDCVSIFALSSQTAWDTFNLIRGFDPQDPFSRPAVDPQGSPHREALQSFRFGVPAPAQVSVQPVKTEITPPLAIPSREQAGAKGTPHLAGQLHERP
jgi:allophanate hydrolase